MKKELMLELLNTKQYKQLHTLLMENNTVDIAYLLQQIEIDDCAIAFRLLSKKKAAQVFSNMDIKTQSQLVELFSEKELESLIENQYMDDLVDLIEELPANLVTRLLKHVDENQRQVINQLLSYPKDSAGTIMTTEFLSLKKETQLEDALNYIKQNGNHCKSIYTSYVCQDKKLIGIVSTKDILLNDENKSIEEIMKEDFQYVYTHTDQEEVVNIFRKYDLVVLPVLDDEKMEFKGLNIFGLSFTFGDKEDVSNEQLKQATDDDTVNIINYHVPYAWDLFARLGYNLQLSGHTHGGQFYPMNLFCKLMFKYNKGIFEENGNYLSVTTGVGSMDTPMRWGTDSELVILKLRKK